MATEANPETIVDLSLNPHYINVFPDLQSLFDELKDEVIRDEAAFVNFVKHYQYGPDRAHTNWIFKQYMDRTEKACLSKEMELEERCQASGIDTS